MADAFNVFNRTNFGNPGGALGSANFGGVSSTSTLARNVQLALKFLC